MSLDSGWYLEGLVDSRPSTWRTSIDTTPFVVGRTEECNLRLESPGISSQHAELTLSGGELEVRDLGSTNGTFVNYERLALPTRLGEGDLIHFADQEFRLVRVTEESTIGATVALDMASIEEAKQAVLQKDALLRMVESQLVTALFQPLVRLEDQGIFGFEMLGRGNVEELATAPNELLAAAEAHDLAVPLAETFRRQGARAARSLPDGVAIFFNSHPSELERPRQLAAAVADLQKEMPGARVVLEIHEMTVTDIDAFKPLREELSARGVALAFDDFGKGRSRLAELVDLAPEFLKFDRSLIHEIDRVKPRRREMVGTLVSMVRDMEIRTLAEGVETQAEAQICRQLGFDYAQGYYFGRPQPAETFRETAGKPRP